MRRTPALALVLPLLLACGSTSTDSGETPAPVVSTTSGASSTQTSLSASDATSAGEAVVQATTDDVAAQLDAIEPVEIAGFYTLDTETLEGEPVDLEIYAGQVAVIVNVASECGFTPQYAELQELYETYGPRGLVVLGFPSNEFGGQEPGTPEQIRLFCSERYDVSFPLFAKCRTQPGDDQSPVYEFLQAETDAIPNWNFCKYVIGRDGEPIAFFKSRTAPSDPELIAVLEEAL